MKKNWLSIIVLFCVLMLCMMLIAMGVGIWFTSFVWVFKFILSFVLIIAGTAFAILGIDLWRDE